MNIAEKNKEILEKGFTVITDVFNKEEIAKILKVIESADSRKPSFRRKAALFAIRKFLIEVPQIVPLLFTTQLRSIINDVFGSDFFLIKSVYFDKPAASNWFVSYHQDLMISVNTKADLEGFGPWTNKNGEYAVQPPVEYLDKNFTLRIHLDDTDENNGALKVIPGSYKKGIYRFKMEEQENATICNVSKGSVMIMKPLLHHSSSRCTNDNRRRVIHLEFSNMTLPYPLEWNEKLKISTP